MMTLFIEYKLDSEAALKACDCFNALLIEPSIVQSKEELNLAEFLSKRSFEKKKNIAKKFKYEFLLWLTGKRDIKSAMKVSEPKNDSAVLILFEGKDKRKMLKALNAKEKKLDLKKEADALALERISLSRI